MVVTDVAQRSGEKNTIGDQTIVFHKRQHKVVWHTAYLGPPFSARNASLFAAFTEIEWLHKREGHAASTNLVTANLPQLNDPTTTSLGTKVMVMLLLKYSQQWYAQGQLEA